MEDTSRKIGRILEGNIKMDLVEFTWEGVDETSLLRIGVGVVLLRTREKTSVFIK
jgi:hypothetical protein